jgi:hypothetical protein
MRGLPACSFVSMICRVLISANFPFAGVVAVGQETSAPQDAPSATQTQSKPLNLIQHDDQHEPSKNHILWIIPNHRSIRANPKCCSRRYFQPLLSGSGSIVWKYCKQVGATNSLGHVLPMMGKMAWLTIVFQNRQTIFKLAREVLFGRGRTTNPNAHDAYESVPTPDVPGGVNA